MASSDGVKYASGEALSNLQFPVYERDWSAQEELALLDGVQKFGLGNWKEISGVVGTKTETRCQRHFLAVYMESATAPIPDPRATLLEYLPQGGAADAPSLPSLPGVPDYVSAVAGSVPVEWLRPPPDAPTFLLDTMRAGTLDGGEAGIYLDVDDAALVGRDLPDDEAANTCDMAGYSPLRGDFDVEHANDAEQVIADMEFPPGESPAAVELKLKVLEIYNAQLDERARRKAFLLQRGLLNYRKALSVERRRGRAEREIRAQMRPLARFMSPAEHEEVVNGLVMEERLRQRVAKLQEYRANGVRTLAEADGYDLAKKRRAESGAVRSQQAKLGALYAGVPATAAVQAGPLPTPSAPTPAVGEEGGRGRSRGRSSSISTPGGALPASAVLESGADLTAVPPAVSAALSGAPGHTTLTPDEAALCSHLQLLPSHYHAIRDAVLIAARNKEAGEELEAAASTAGGAAGVPTPLTKVVLDYVVSCGWVDAANLWEDGAVTSAPDTTAANSLPTVPPSSAAEA